MRVVGGAQDGLVVNPVVAVASRAVDETTQVLRVGEGEAVDLDGEVPNDGGLHDLLLDHAGTRCGNVAHVGCPQRSCVAPATVHGQRQTVVHDRIEVQHVHADTDALAG